jgi:ABC-type methionine transport system ATPase subunit
VVLATRLLTEVEPICAAAAVLAQGRIAAQGPVGEIAGASRTGAGRTSAGRTLAVGRAA